MIVIAHLFDLDPPSELDLPCLEGRRLQVQEVVLGVNAPAVATPEMFALPSVQVHKHGDAVHLHLYAEDHHPRSGVDLLRQHFVIRKDHPVEVLAPILVDHLHLFTLVDKL